MRCEIWVLEFGVKVYFWIVFVCLGSRLKKLDLMQKLESISKIISFLLEFYGQIGKIKAISYSDYVFLTDTIGNGLDRKLTMTWPDSLKYEYYEHSY